jgi:membrane protein
VGTSPAQLLDRARRFLLHELWQADFGPRGLWSWLLSGLQLSAVIGRGFVNDQLLLRASALTYITSLAIIPILVVVLSVINWLGLSRDLVIAGVNQFLAGSPEAVERIMDFVEGANVGALGSVSGAIFLVTTVLSLRHVEETFNEIWGALHSRSWIRRFTNYLSVLVAGPLLLGSLVSLSSDLSDGALVAQLNVEPLVDVATGLVLGFGPLLFLFGSFSLAYFLLPNTPVRVSSAMIGGIVAALLFTLAQYFYVSFSVGAARYDSLFGGFAIIPLLLVWIYLSWAVVLLGAEIAYAHQNLARYRREARDSKMEPAEREAVGLRVIVEIARAFRDRWPPQTAEELAERLESSLRIVTELMVRLGDAGIVTICRGADGDAAAFQLGRPAESIQLGDVLAAVRGRRLEAPAMGGNGDVVQSTVREVDSTLRDLEASLDPVRERSLADLLDRLPPRTLPSTA